MAFPMAYHITWGTYGTRLHGGDRVTVDRKENQFGDPIIGIDPDWQMAEQRLMRFPQRLLSLEQKLFVQNKIPEICQRGKWNFIATAAAKNHVHNVVGAAVDGKDIRKWLKRWISEAMNAQWPLKPDEVWWAECGSVKWIWNRGYYERVVQYVEDQRARQS
jgi:REP element-mobilizing transposase RayT